MLTLELFGEGAISNTTTHVCTNVVLVAVWKANDFVMFDENAITFQCTKDKNATNHSYPRRIDPTFGSGYLSLMYHTVSLSMLVSLVLMIIMIIPLCQVCKRWS